MSGRNILKWTVTYEQQKIKLWAVNKYNLSSRQIIWIILNNVCQNLYFNLIFTKQCFSM